MECSEVCLWWARFASWQRPGFAHQVAADRADEPARDRAGRAEHGAADRSACHGEYKCHQSTPGKANAKASRRRHQGAIATSATHAPSCACAIRFGAVAIAACLAEERLL